MEELLLSLADSINFFLCAYIIGVVIIRLTMMSWKTHRKIWQVIYFFAGVCAASYIYLLLSNTPHTAWPALFGFLHMALWFLESRERWILKPPEYMTVDCPHLHGGEPLPEGCPLSRRKAHG